MIFDLTDIEEAAPNPPAGPVSARHLLTACAQEAGRLAEDIDRIDHAFAALLQSHHLPAQLLQQIDLARQEAAGLAGVLQVIAAAPAPDHLVDAETLAQILRLGAQHARISLPDVHGLSGKSIDN